MSGNQPYHKSCYKEQYHPKCDVCKQFVRFTSFFCYIIKNLYFASFFLK
jgi:hypothetical protein